MSPQRSCMIDRMPSMKFEWSMMTRLSLVVESVKDIPRPYRKDGVPPEMSYMRKQNKKPTGKTADIDPWV